MTLQQLIIGTLIFSEGKHTPKTFKSQDLWREATKWEYKLNLQVLYNIMRTLVQQLTLTVLQYSCTELWIAFLASQPSGPKHADYESPQKF